MWIFIPVISDVTKLVIEGAQVNKGGTSRFVNELWDEK